VPHDFARKEFMLMNNQKNLLTYKADNGKRYHKVAASESMQN
jgi:hypothetical protein